MHRFCFTIVGIAHDKPHGGPGRGIVDVQFFGQGRNLVGEEKARLITPRRSECDIVFDGFVKQQAMGQGLAKLIFRQFQQLPQADFRRDGLELGRFAISEFYG